MGSWVKLSTAHWLILATLACFLGVGLPYWFIPYDQVSLPSTLLTPTLLILVAASSSLCALRNLSFWKATWVIGASVPLAVMARVNVETTRDPTSHNLWPLEIIIALMVGFACTAAGALLGKCIGRFSHSRSKNEQP